MFVNIYTKKEFGQPKCYDMSKMESEGQWTATQVVLLLFTAHKGRRRQILDQQWRGVDF